jgi:hypothetical protein
VNCFLKGIKKKKEERRKRGGREEDGRRRRRRKKKEGRRKKKKPGMVTHACNPTNSRGGDQKDHSSSPAQAKNPQDPI